ncbi:unnamed protein product [Candida verbasci]|uniref:Protein HIR n=1 Tax=Candida verbasci TaxID=1227364 RepID=A0A9W4TTW3_9ASCO|nr:unnamed protein product [Candida verbasci]
MQILKLPWLGHKTENKNIECYSVTINHNGTRLASGGLDGNIKIWDIKTIQSFYKLSTDLKISPIELPDKSIQRPLCSMSRHNGVVTSLKFSPDNRWLASGSDDKIVLIWEIDNSQRPKSSFGIEEEDLEHWTVRKRLVAHDNDIQDICWSPDGNLLITVGLDRSIIIWNGLTFERIKRYDIHQSMVKGVVFDPANKFFATASDDRTVRIFRYYKKLNEYNNYEFQMEHIVTEPFKKSPLTSYFKRMSWSPDGQHIAVPNATNGPVSSVVIINRGNWDTNVSLIGHEAPVEVCSFSPKLFQETATTNEDDKFHTILATGGQDRTLAIWSTSNSRPIVICADIVEKTITDICWNFNGEELFFSCLDGSITCIKFESNELGKVVSEQIIDQQLNRYGADREQTILPESIDQLKLEEQSKDARAIQLRRMMPIEKKPEPVPTPSPITPNLMTKIVIDTEKLRKQTVTITKSGKKRVSPLLVSSSQTTTEQPVEKKRKINQISNIKLSQQSYHLPKSGISTTIYGLKKKETSIPAVKPIEDDNDNEDMNQEETTTLNSQTVSEQALKRQKNRNRRKVMESKYPTSFKFISNLPEVVFTNNGLLNVEINKIYKNYNKNKEKDIIAEISTSSSLEFDEDVIFSVIYKSINHKQKENQILNIPLSDITTTIEVRNGKPWNDDDNTDRDFDDPTKVIISNVKNQERSLVMFFPFRIQHILPIIISNEFKYILFCSFNGSIVIISASTGRYICPTIEIGENIITLLNKNEYILILTSSGLIYGWNLKSMKNIYKKVSIATILNNFEIKENKVIMPIVKFIDINESNGSPLVMIEHDYNVYEYDLELECWIKLIDSWYYQVDRDFSIDNESVDKMIYRSKLIYDNDRKLQKIYSYKFKDDNELLPIMKLRNNEMIENIH